LVSNELYHVYGHAYDVIGRHFIHSGESPLVRQHAGVFQSCVFLLIYRYQKIEKITSYEYRSDQNDAAKRWGIRVFRIGKPLLHLT
jgi:hypothetical protein